MASWPSPLHLYRNPDGTTAGFATDPMVIALEREDGPFEIGVYLPTSALQDVVEELERLEQANRDEAEGRFGDEHNYPMGSAIAFKEAAELLRSLLDPVATQEEGGGSDMSWEQLAREGGIADE